MSHGPLTDKRVHFPGLNGLRFIAAYFVIIGHIELFKFKAGLTTLISYEYTHPLLSHLGRQGVNIFFVLSGFLITYLLISEFKFTENINIGKFYIRRILRIWPLYFFIVLLSFFLLPYILNPAYFIVKTHPYFGLKLGLMVFLLPNLAYYAFGHIFSAGLLWSIGTEEQFYLAWPHIIKRSIKSPLKVFIALLILFISTKLICDTIVVIWGDIINHYVNRGLRVISLFVQYDSMVIGAIAAYIYFSRKRQVLSILYNRKLQILVYISTLLLLLINPDLISFRKPIYGSFSNLIYGSLYGIIILNVATNENSILKLRNKVLDVLGQISYGIYMYHSVAIVVSILLLTNLFAELGVLPFNLLLYMLSSILSIGLASLSYYSFERPILGYKTKFMIVKSGRV